MNTEKRKADLRLYGKKHYHKNKDKIAISKKEKGYAKIYYDKHKYMFWIKSIKNDYNLSVEAYEVMFQIQNGRCAICGKTVEDNGRRLAVDHDHVSGKVRGLLCVNCNQGIGRLQDDSELIRKAADYLDKHKS